MDLKEEQAIGGDPASHWYYIAKGRAIKSLLGAGGARSVLDVGAGSGVFSHMLVSDGIAERAVCVDPNYDAATINSRSDERISFVHNVTATDADTVLMIDVIEHVDDDVALIRDYANIVKPGTQFIISVPAFDFLWSEHDDFLEHRRRYTLDRLRASVVAAGLQPVETRYFFGMLFPAVAAMRLAANAMRGDRQAEKSALKAAPEWLNKSLVAVHDIERALLFPFNRIAGVTAFCVATKPDEATGGASMKSYAAKRAATG